MRELQYDIPEILEDEDIDAFSRQFLGWQVELIHLSRGPTTRSSVIVPLESATIALMQVRRAAALRVLSGRTQFSLMSTSPASPPPRVSARPLVGGVCLMLGPQATTEIYLPKNCCAFIMSMPCSAVLRNATSEPTSTFPARSRADLRALSTEHGALLSKCMDLLECFRRSGTSEAIAVQVQRRLQELLGSSAAKLFLDSNALPPDANATTVRRRSVTRACAFIDAHFSKPITLDDLCIAAGVRARTLEYGFREFYNLGPMAYLRSVRLCRVRQELLNARGASSSVANAARRSHFTHMGQFSRDYRLLFGESPSSTLARGRARSLATSNSISDTSLNVP